jgi:hypothetical protein
MLLLMRTDKTVYTKLGGHDRMVAMPTEYFSERESGSRPREDQEIRPSAWGGIVSLVESAIESGAFGIDFPDRACPDGPATTGTNARAFRLALEAEVPGIEWPLRVTTTDDVPFGTPRTEPWAPPTILILDLVEFCHAHVAKPSGSLHSFFAHDHLSFNREAGQLGFRGQVNRIFARNGLAYEVCETGRVERLAPTVLRETLAAAVFQTGDTTLDTLLEQARAKFWSPSPTNRQESLEKLWDAWERLKSIENAADKKLSIGLLLDRASAEPMFRAALDSEARELTRIGNEFRIRHAELKTIPIEDSSHIDYLFHRLFALVHLLLGKRSTSGQCRPTLGPADR